MPLSHGVQYNPVYLTETLQQQRKVAESYLELRLRPTLSALFPVT